MNPQRIQLSRRKGWRMPENTAKVDRTTPWGNPYIVGKHGTRAECVRLHVLLMGGYISLGDNNVEAQRAHRDHVNKHREELRGKNLACWCSLPKPAEPDLCHADVLLEIVNAPR